MILRDAFILRENVGGSGKPEAGLSVELLSEVVDAGALVSGMCPFWVRFPAASVQEVGPDLSVVRKGSGAGAEIHGLMLPSRPGSNAAEVAGRFLEICEWFISPDDAEVESIKRKSINR